MAAGADVIELGVPYSDPLADGPVIHAAGTRALAAGANVAGVLEVAAGARAERPGGADVLRQHGVRARASSAFVERLARDRRLRPDRPRPAARARRPRCSRPATRAASRSCRSSRRRRTPERLAAIGARARGFLYTVSVVGTTGERAALGERFAEVVARARAAHRGARSRSASGSARPSRPREAADAGADGVIVGTRLVRAAAEAEDPADAVGALVAELAAGLADRPGSAARIPRAWD